MNLRSSSNTCDLDRLEAFFSGDLSDAQEREFTLHLNTCENCRRSLEQQAAGPECWKEAESLLKPIQFESLYIDDLSSAGIVTQATRQSFQFQNVLDALGPTDDPAMLGRLGGYEVSGVVGSGGMGVVLKAIDKSLDRTVAIKVLAPHLATSGAARKRFAREAKAAAAVLHPNVTAIHSVSNDEALPYLVMPYIRGSSLQQRLDREGSLSLNEILRIGSQIAAGLAAAHAQGLVHRDIKPANILLEEGVERVTITDFGLARAVDDATITQSGVIAGTPQFMSPEQSRGEAIDARSDLFSLGSVLYAMCTGHPPFRAETGYGTLRRITDAEPRSIREINPEVPEWFEAIIRRLHAKDPDKRFPSAEQLAELLEGCLAHVQQPTRMPLPAELPKVAAPKARSFVPQILGVLVMLGTIAIGLLGFLVLTGDPPDIAGQWSGEGWGQVVLKKSGDREYAGSYTGTLGQEAGEIQLKWSRIERRYHGMWREGEDRFGEISVRLVGDAIRGAWTVDRGSRINPATPRLADLKWVRAEPQEEARNVAGGLDNRVPFEGSELAGLWQLENQTFGGKKPEGGAEGTVTFQDNRVRFNLNQAGGDALLDKPLRYFSVNAARSPAEINLYGDNFLIQGVYKLDGDELTLALYGRSEIGRPRSFAVDDAQPEGQTLVVMTFRRRDGAASVAPMPDRGPAEPRHINSYGTSANGNHMTIACSADGKRIAIASGNPTRILQTDGTSRVEGKWQPVAEVLDAETGKTVVSLKLSTDEEDAVLATTPTVSHYEVTALAFSPDGRLLAVGTSIGQVKLFDAQSGELVRSLDDKQAKRADYETPNDWKSLHRAMGSVRSLAFSPDGSLLAVCGGSFADFSDVLDGVGRLGRKSTGPGRLKVFKTKTGALKDQLAGHSHAEAVAFSHDGSLLASAGQWGGSRNNGTGVIVWNSETGESIPVQANGGAHAVAFSPDDKVIVIGSRNFDRETDTSTTTIAAAYPLSGIVQWQRTIPGYANPKAFSPDGKSILVLCGGKSIQFLSVETGELRHELKPLVFWSGERWTDFAVAGPAGRLAIGGVDDQQTGIAELWDLAHADGGPRHAGPAGAASAPSLDAPQPASAVKAAEDEAARTAPTFDITGVVLSEHKQPLADAEVRLLETYTHSEKLHTATRTDREGRFVLKDVPQEKEAEGKWRYTLVISAPSFASRVVFVPYARKEPIDFELALSAPAALRGRVVDADGGAVEGAMVWAPPFKQFIPGIHSATTNASGHFQIGDLAPWNSAEAEAAGKAVGDEGWSGVKYALRVYHPDHGRTVAYYAQVPTTLFIRFDSPIRVSGQVFDRQSGFPIAGATVRAGTVAAATDAEGRYQLKIQPLEDLSVQVELGAAKSQSIALKGAAGAAVTLSDLYLRSPQPAATVRHR